MTASANDVTENINYKLHFLNRKLITEGILCYVCHKSTFEGKLNVCRQTGAGMQFHFITIYLRCFEKGACAFIVYVGNSGISSVFAIFRLRYTIKSIMQFVEFKQFLCILCQKSVRKSFYLYVFLISYFIKSFLIASSQYLHLLMTFLR